MPRYREPEDYADSISTGMSISERREATRQLFIQRQREQQLAQAEAEKKVALAEVNGND